MSRRAFIVGAGGAVGEAIAHSLLRRGWEVAASMRRANVDAWQRLTAAGAEVFSLDLEDRVAFEEACHHRDAIVFTTHLERTARALTQVTLKKPRILAHSSNNVAVHSDSPTYRALIEAEASLRVRSPEAILIRPTLIFGDPRLRTVARLMRMAHALPVLAMPGTGSARVQPIFHEDLGELAAGLLDLDVRGGVYAAGGPDIVTMRELFEMTIRVVGGRAVVFPVSGSLLAIAAALRLGGFTREQAARANRDRVAVVQTPLPLSLTPATPLQSGLLRLWSAMGRTTD